MKFIVFMLVLLSNSLFAGELFEDQDLSCEVINDSSMTIPLYDDIFVIEVRKSGLSKIKYKRKYQGQNSYGPLYTIRGCYHARQVEGIRGSISVECLEDGQEGSIFIEPASMEGELYFYYPKIGYPERSGFRVKCKHI